MCMWLGTLEIITGAGVSRSINIICIRSGFHIKGNEDEIRSSGMKSGVLFSLKYFFMNLDNPSAAMDLNLNILVARKKLPIPPNCLLIGNILLDFFPYNGICYWYRKIS